MADAALMGTPALTPVSIAPKAYAYLSAVRVAGHDAFDRVVFEFESGTPGYSVRYVDRPVTEDGSGDEVEVEGQAILYVHMEAASTADLSGDELRMTYTGPRRVRGATKSVTEVVRGTDFEANLDWAIGVRSKLPFSVSTLDDRLVVDIANN